MSDKTITNVSGRKEFKFAGLKTSASTPTDAQLKLINQFTRQEYKAEDFYVGQLRLANNAIDRDNERFSEEVLTRFAATAIRKTMLFDHSRDSQNKVAGKFFDVTIEKLPLQQANAETGENFQMPAGKNEVWFLTVSFYIPIKFVAESVLVGIDTGIYDFASIGFRAESLVPIADLEGKTLYWEYRGTGQRTEMTEGSLVYLGAQHGMGVKSAGSGQIVGERPSQTKTDDDSRPLKPLTAEERRKSDNADDPLRPLKPEQHKLNDDDRPLRPSRPKSTDISDGDSLRPLRPSRHKSTDDDSLRPKDQEVE